MSNPCFGLILQFEVNKRSKVIRPTISVFLYSSFAIGERTLNYLVNDESSKDVKDMVIYYDYIFKNR